MTGCDIPFHESLKLRAYLALLLPSIASVSDRDASWAKLQKFDFSSVTEIGLKKRAARRGKDRPSFSFGLRS